MSLLTPLYALGLLAITAPILFHLIRRAPKGEVPFSSLMFLAPTPPRLTRRSRLDNLLLLLLRAAALGLLAFAFARPFLRKAAQLDFGDVERRRVAVLVDTSASMRRGTLWAKAKALADETIAGCRPADQVALLAFDSGTRPLVGFAESATLDPARRRAVAKGQLDRLAPTWGATNLGQALVDAVAAIEDVADASEKAGRMPRRVVLISDLQQGSRLDALGDFEWPTDVELDLKTVTDNGSNAGVHPLAETVESQGPAAPAGAGAGTAKGPAAAGPQRRVRVSNDPGSHRESFSISWVQDDGQSAGKPIEVYVPPGESRVVRVPRPPGTATYQALRLTGDQVGFDNTLHVADEKRDEATVFYVGNDAADDPQGLLYFIQRVFSDTPRRTVRIRAMAPSAPIVWEPERSLPLVMLTAETNADNARRLRAYAQSGGTVLDVLTAPGRAQTLAAIADVPPPDLKEATVARDVLLGEIAFDHPLFASLSAAQFNDFTKIHFWKYRKVPADALGESRVLAKFENGDPAVIEKPIGKGRLVVLTSGWQPSDSQLARSSKFVPMMAALLEGRDPRLNVAANVNVGDRVALPPPAGRKGLTVHKPDRSVVKVAATSPYFTATDLPGVYTLDTDAGPRPFAVNLDPAESKVAPLSVETLEQFGCRLVNHSPAKVDREHLRQMQNAELENRQKLWRWLIVAVIGVLIVETWLAGRHPRSRPARAEALST